MKSYSFRHLLAAAVPLLSMAGALAGFRLFCSLMEVTEVQTGTVTIGVWSQIFMALICTFLCGLIALWWAGGYFFYIYQCILFQLRISARAPSLPSWAPVVLKVLISGSLSVSFLAGPQQAHALTVESSKTRVSQTSETRPMLNSLEEQLNTQPRTENYGDPSRTVSSPSSATPLFGSAAPETSTSVTLVSAQSTPSVSPLFGGFTSPSQDYKNTTLEQTSNGNAGYSHYTVKPGDSLWSIAENHMPEEASGAEVLHFVHQLQGLNIDSIPTLDSYIFPGQQILLPQ